MYPIESRDAEYKILHIRLFQPPTVVVLSSVGSRRFVGQLRSGEQGSTNDAGGEEMPRPSGQAQPVNLLFSQPQAECP